MEEAVRYGEEVDFRYGFRAFQLMRVFLMLNKEGKTIAAEQITKILTYLDNLRQYCKAEY